LKSVEVSRNLKAGALAEFTSMNHSGSD
jgi:hypothetical protein